MKKIDFNELIFRVSKLLIKLLVVVMVIALILGSVQLITSLVQKIINPPYPFMMDVKELYDVFKLVLIVIVGYELIKSIMMMISSDIIPVASIINVAIIALANKIITLDIHDCEPYLLVGIAALMFSLGAARYLVINSEK